MIPKYRIWSKILHVMGEMTGLNFYKNAYHQVCFQYTDPTRKGIDGKNRVVDESHLFDEEQDYMPVVFMQSTALKDKNGVEIYEGDIIRLVTSDNEEISIICEFGNIRRPIYDYEVEITGFYFVRSNDGRKTFPITNNYLGKHDTEIWEVIGNIHEEKADTI